MHSSYRTCCTCISIINIYGEHRFQNTQIQFLWQWNCKCRGKRDTQIFIRLGSPQFSQWSNLCIRVSFRLSFWTILSMEILAGKGILKWILGIEQWGNPLAIGPLHDLGTRWLLLLLVYWYPQQTWFHLVCWFTLSKSNIFFCNHIPWWCAIQNQSSTMKLRIGSGSWSVSAGINSIVVPLVLVLYYFFPAKFLIKVKWCILLPVFLLGSKPSSFSLRNCLARELVSN